jgi:hypothetical protein
MTIQELKVQINTKTLNFLLLSTITAGIYSIIWLVKNQEIIENLFKSEKSNKNFILYIAVCTGFGGILSQTEVPVLLSLSMFLSLVSWVLYLAWSLKIKKAILDYTLNECRINYNMNTFYTVLFSIYYINYCIRELDERIEKEKVLNSLV